MSFSQDVHKKIFRGCIVFIFGAIFLCVGVLLLFSDTIFSEKLAQTGEKEGHYESFSQSDNSVKNSSKSSSIFDSKKIRKAYDILESNFYGFDKKTEQEIEDGILSSLVSSLGDKHSEYFTQEGSEEFQSELAGDFEGIGAVVKEDDLGVKLERILPDSPAQKFGLMMGDIVTEIDGENIAGMTTTEAVKLIRGEKGTPVSLLILREGEKLNVSVIRDSVNIPSVDSAMLENSQIGYIQINTFGEKTPKEFGTAWKKLHSDGVKGIILDFRFNGGGYLESAQEILAYFLPRNSKIVTVKENNPIKNDSLFTGLFSNPDTEIPVVVLVNEFSASASEIVAGAVQDYKRGIILGTKTYGKGSVQQMFPFSDGSMMKITIAHWYTPHDKNIDQEGIDPDITVEIEKEDYKEKFDRQKDVAQKVLQSLIDGKNQEEIIKLYQ